MNTPPPYKGRIPARSTPRNETKYVLGIDIGGTKIEAQLFRVSADHLEERAVWKHSEDTVRGVRAHADQIASVIDKAAQAATRQDGKLAAVGIGSPGRFDEEGRIKPGTNTNLGKYPDEFDNVNLWTNYKKALKNNHDMEGLPVFVKNDGNAMLAGILEHIQGPEGITLADQDGDEIGKFSLQRKHVALFGIGTGIGHAIASVGDDGGYQFVTDGHASKLRIAVDEEDMPLLKAGKKRIEKRSGKKEVLMFADDTARAEDLFRGPMISAMAGVDTGHAIDLNKPDHKKAIAFAGKYMARTIEAIRSGESRDVEPDHGWSREDRQEAAKTSIYLIGGGFGRSDLGKAVIQAAADTLHKDGISDIQLVQVPGENVAARAAAMLVPQTVYRTMGRRFG